MNNYVAQKKNGKLKVKGWYNDKPFVEDSHNSLVVAKALQKYFIEGIDPDKFIKSHTNIFDFCESKKISKDYTIYYNGEVQQQLNRFYVSKKGSYLYKQKEGKKTMENVLKGNPVVIFNKYEEKPFRNYEVDYSYYIKKAKDLIYDIEKDDIQLTIF